MDIADIFNGESKLSLNNLTGIHSLEESCLYEN